MEVDDMKTVYDDLKDFFEWLVESQYVQRRTATTYTSYVRKALRTFGDAPTAAEVESYFDQRSDTSSGKAERMAWGKYAQWGEETFNTRIPKPTKVTKPVARSAGVDGLPDRVLASLHFLVRRCNFDLHMIEKMFWGNVILLKTGKYTASVSGSKRTYTLPGPCVEVIREYAQPQNAHSPFIPVQPKSLFSYGLKSVRSQLLSYEARLVEAERLEKPLFPDFDPYAACLEEEKEVPKESTVVSIEPIEEEDEIIVPKHTTDDLLRMIDATGPKPSKRPTLKVIDFDSFERRRGEDDD
jgi:hypothetical protein